MVKPFEEAVFSLEENELSELVETEFGLHIIMLTEIKGENLSFDKLKTQIKGELIYGKALGWTSLGPRRCAMSIADGLA